MCRGLLLASVVAAVGLSGCGGGTKTVIERTVTVKGQGESGGQQVIELSQGIGGVNIDMSRAEVERILGRPSKVVNERHPIAGTVARLDYPDGLSVSFASAGAFAVATTSPSAHTADGVGVGSSEGEVHALPGFSGCQTIAGKYGCQVGQARPGSIVNSFTIDGGRVTRVMISRVID